MADPFILCQGENMDKITMHVEALLAGTPQPFRGEERSAFIKKPIAGPVHIGMSGLQGDVQADQVNHGGPDKAVHLYFQDHYTYWRQYMGGHALLDRPGAFGENVAASGLSEDRICLGDRFRLGSALLEVSHGRQPCWKIDHRFGRKDVTAHIVRTAKCGVYFRVLEEGEAEAGKDMVLVARSHPEWSVERIFRLLIGGEARSDKAAVRELAAMPVLAAAWRGRAAKLAEQ